MNSYLQLRNKNYTLKLTANSGKLLIKNDNVTLGRVSLVEIFDFLQDNMSPTSRNKATARRAKLMHRIK